MLPSGGRQLLQFPRVNSYRFPRCLMKRHCFICLDLCPSTPTLSLITSPCEFTPSRFSFHKFSSQPHRTMEKRRSARIKESTASQPVGASVSAPPPPLPTPLFLNHPQQQKHRTAARVLPRALLQLSRRSVVLPRLLLMWQMRRRLS